MNKEMPTKRIMISITAGILTTIILLFLLSSINTTTPYDSTLILNDDWDLSINDTVQYDVLLNQLSFSPTGIGDVVTLTRLIPDNSFAHPSLRIWTCYSMVEVYVAGDLIYQFGKEAYENNDMIGSGFHWITLPHNCSQKELKIVISPGENLAFTNIREVLIDEVEHAYKDFISDHFVVICAGIFLIVFGTGIVIISAILICLSPRYTSLIYTGIFSILIGIWTLSNNGTLQLISDNYTMIQCIEFFSLYLGPIPILLFLISIRKIDKKKFDFAKLLIAVDIFLIALTILLHAKKIMQFPMMVSAFHVFYALMVAYIIISCIRNVLNRNTEELLLLLGIIILAVCLFFDIAFFNITKYINSSFSSYMGITIWGGLAFMICMISSYTKEMYRGAYSSMEKEMLVSMAYMDNLTQLANQAKYAQELLDMETQSKQLTMIMFDLNYLKRTNDTQGHHVGDMLLCCFANVLKNSFPKDALTARIGGDEFVVLIENNDQKMIEPLMAQYQKQLSYENKKKHSFTISAAYGIASSFEDGGITYAEAARRADARMYECKKIMKGL